MLRGLVGGVIWGAVLGGLLLVSASLLMPLPQRPIAGDGPVAAGPTPAVAPPMAAPPAAEAPLAGDIGTDPTARVPVSPPSAVVIDAPAGSEFARVGEDVDPTAPPPDAAPGGATVAPPVVGPEAEAIVAPPVPDSAPAARPDADTGADLALTAPGPEVSAPRLPGGSPAAGAPPAIASRPQAPAGPETAPGPAATPPEPLPEVELLAEDFGPESPGPAGSAADPMPAPDGMGQVAPAPEPIAPTDGPDGTAPDALPGSPASVGEDAVTPPAGEGVDAPAVAAAEPPPVPGSIGQAPRGFGELVPEIPTGRLPRIGGDAPAAAESAPDRPVATLGALARHAAAFDGGGGRPLMSVVLVDDGRGLDPAVLGTFPFPVTFAIPAGRPESAALAATYRAGGFEVVVLAEPLPTGATASDLETAFAAYGAQVPPAVALVEPEQGGFQRDRTLMSQAAAALSASGLGLLLPEGGLPTAEQVAGPMGVPMARVFRRLDAEDENPMTIRRYLDRAAFKAAQDGAVVVMGTTRPETVTALFAWALEGAAEAVALAPLSAVLRAR